MSTRATDRPILVAVLIALGLLLVLPTLFVGTGMLGVGGMMGGAWGGGMWATDSVPWWAYAVWTLSRLLVVGVVLGLGYLGYRALVGADERDAAVEELRRAYARGDLSDEEFERRRERLSREE
ncbi:SHOCT domain-containing protein [Halobaculum marinum]|uniref:SHOCT domain-containing protein n=1 Tax=Halobaculum marinum TaxID=3031996 RepID=A0ABD5X2E3_9EURY|nr:SHOCT domain-containing protein [Halobaculum sp. DT55]